MLLLAYCGGLLIVSHILCTSSLRTSTSLASGVLDLSLITNSRTVLRRLGSGANNFRFTCQCPQQSPVTEASTLLMTLPLLRQHSLLLRDLSVELSRVECSTAGQSCTTTAHAAQQPAWHTLAAHCWLPQKSHLEDCFHQRLPRSLLSAYVMAPDIDQQYICNCQCKQSALSLKVSIIFPTFTAV